jgi:hypothetical protein
MTFFLRYEIDNLYKTNDTDVKEFEQEFFPDMGSYD